MLKKNCDSDYLFMVKPQKKRQITNTYLPVNFLFKTKQMRLTCENNCQLKHFVDQLCRPIHLKDCSLFVTKGGVIGCSIHIINSSHYSITMNLKNKFF